MNMLKKVLSYFIPAAMASLLWDGFVNNMGLIGGVVAAILIIFPTWAINHYNNYTDNADDAAFVDQGLAIFVACQVRDMVKAGSVQPTVNSLPTIGLVILGSALAGYFASKIQEKK